MNYISVHLNAIKCCFCLSQAYRFTIIWLLYLALIAYSLENNLFNDIVRENQLKGDTSWWYPQPTKPEAVAKVLSLIGFTTQFSFLPSDTVYFKLKSSRKYSSNINMRIYRLGYYSGAGARLVHELTDISVTKQKHCMYEAESRMVDCSNWDVTTSWNIPDGAITGVYIALPYDPKTNVLGQYIPFVIRRYIAINNTSKHDILFKTADTTWVAYNKYGSWNVYRGNGSFEFSSRAFKASYNRPFVNRLPKPNGQHENFIFGSEYSMLYWLEKHGYEVSYASCYDIERYAIDGSLYQSFNLLLSVGHDEYWTEDIKEAYTVSRNRGVHLAFFSGNEVFWRILWEQTNIVYQPTANTVSSTDGTFFIANRNISENIGLEPRIIVCRKESIEDHIPSLSSNIPSKLSNSSSDHWTGTFIDPRNHSATPTNELTGQYFMVNGFRNDSITVRRKDAALRFWRNTTIHKAAKLHLGGYSEYKSPIGVLGYEWDVFSDDCYRPAGLISLSWTTFRISKGLIESYGASYKGSGVVSHHVSMYRYISPDYILSNKKDINSLPKRGVTSLVFATGTIQWPWALSAVHDGYAMPVDYVLQQATINIFADMSVQPQTLQGEGKLHYASQSIDRVPPISFIHHLSNQSQCNGELTITGHAIDRGGGRVASVEVSFDNGVTWHIANGKEHWTIKYNLNSRINKNCSLHNSLPYLKYDEKSASRAMVMNYENKFNRLIPLKSGASITESEKGWKGIRDISIISRAVDDSGWIEGCCGYPLQRKFEKRLAGLNTSVSNYIHIPCL